LAQQRNVAWLIGIAEIAGGVLAAMAMIIALKQRYFVMSTWVIAIALAIAATSVGGGALLLQGSSSGRRLSIGLQAAQVLQFTLPTWTYRTVLGPFITVELSIDGLMAHVGASGSAGVFVLPVALQPGAVTCTINLVAIAALAFLVQYGTPTNQLASNRD
jgi:hypothetical protein